MTTVITREHRPKAKPPAGGDSPDPKLYKRREPIYPKLAHGRWRNIKWAVLVATLAVYYVTPWIRWHRPEGAAQQAVLVDLTGGRFYFFFIQLWPQEFYYVTALLVIAALALFLTTALFGRLWCGYACPQTVWTDLFIVVERAFEGDRNARMRLDQAPWSFDKAWRKIGKHLVWIGIAFGTGGAWIFYFRDAPTLLREFWTLKAPITSYVSCAVLTFTTYWLAGGMREQVCTYMCPWPRIQGAMLDNHSLQVTYRFDRGEPRAPHKKGDTWEGRGDCIDCTQCVVVCPMGIDIRDGPQMECINCGLCIDACDEIMDKVGRPRGLIGYDTDHAVLQRSCGVQPEYRLLRPRTLYYAVALAAVSAIVGWGLLHRSTIDLHVLRDRNPTHVRLHDGAVRNGYTLKIANRSFEPRKFAVTFDGVEGATMKVAGAQAADIGAHSISVQVGADQTRAVRVFVTAPPQEFHDEELKAEFEIEADRQKVEVDTVFVTGMKDTR
ncbi:MAG TPA: cytochrome c oxidase accessory protein CcoG [Caulobacteraceae bacterium]|nr:cytochrome c oxidase accessory protein CcoG [Caulobacteraceae bacterium]